MAATTFAGMDLIDIGLMAGKLVFIIVVILHVAPIMAWVERRGSALMQNRLGPNRIGPLGLIQSLADAIKFIFKEDDVPGHVNKFYYLLAPVISIIPTFMTLAVIPFAYRLNLPDGRVFDFQAANLNIGLLYILAVGSLGVYGIIMASWASNNKYALLGGLRSTSQMISYELSLGLSVIGIVMAFSSVQLNEIVFRQGEVLFYLGPLAVQKWGIFIQPVGFLIFLIASFAETNRLPFDLPEGESEIVAGYHLEYGSMKFAMFQIAEYGNMFVASCLMTSMYFGGWHLFPPLNWVLAAVPIEAVGQFGHDLLRMALQVASVFIKAGAFMWFFVWVRWTIPRFRYDQLMDLGWKIMLPLALTNIFATGLLIQQGWI